MGIMDRVWAATKFLVRIEDKVASWTETVKLQQQKIEQLYERLLRLEMLAQLGAYRATAHATKPIGTNDDQSQ